MRRAFKYLAIVLGSLVALCLIAFAVLVNLDFNDYKYMVEAEVREQTGRDLEIRGRLDVDISLQPSVSVSDVRLANASWGSSPDMLTLEQFSAQIDLVPLIFDNVLDVHKVELRGVDLLVEKNRDGQTNLEFRELATRKPAEAAPVEDRSTVRGPAGISLPILRDVSLSNIQMRYNDMATGQKRNLQVDNLSVGGEGPFNPLSIDLSGQADGIPLKLAGGLGSPSEMLNPDRIWTVDLQGDLAGTMVTIAGGIDEPAAGKGINIVFGAETPEIGNLSRIAEPLVGQTVPALGPLKLSVLVSGDADDVLSANDILVSLGKPGNLSLQVSGTVGNVMTQDDVDIRGSVAVPDISRLSAVAGQSIPALGALESNFLIRGDAGSGVALEEFNFELSRSGVLRVAGQGAVADLLTQRGVDLKVDLLVPNVKNLPSVNDIALPDAGRVEASFVVAGDMATALSLRDLKANLSRPDTYSLVLDGTIADLLNQAGIDLGFDFSTPNPGRLSAVAQADIPDMAAVSAVGRLKGGATDAASIEGLAIKIGESDVAGDINLSGLATRPSLSATLNANVIRLQDVTPATSGQSGAAGGGGAGQNAPAPTAGANDGRVIPNDPIDLSGLRMADADVALAIGKLVMPGGGFKDARLKLTLQDGMLSVTPISLADDNGGTFSGTVTLDARREAADLKVDMKADQLELSNLMRLAGQPGVIEGPADMALVMTATGRSPRELAASLTGKVNTAVTEGFVNSEETRKAFGRTTQVVTDLLLGNSKEKRIPLYCFVADYEANKGAVKTKTLVLDTRISTILSSGDLNLGTETLNLTVNPTRDVLGLGAEIPVRVQGTFAKPKVFPDPALAALGIGSAILGAPLIPLEMLGDAVLANDNESPCVNLRPENREKQSQQQGGQQEQDPKKRLEDAGKKALEGLLKKVVPQQ